MYGSIKAGEKEMKSDTRNNYHKSGMRTEKQGKRPAAPVREMRTQKEQTVQLTVRGMSRGIIRMEAEDGTAFSCAKENARGAIFPGRHGLAERIDATMRCRKGIDACA
ncbi:MAG: hypothetical protein V8Q79_06970 [Christensenellales bacterium]